jgi:hypothetical protein
MELETREVLVTWRDEPQREFYALVAISEDSITDYSEGDDEIFFYFTTEEAYKEALANGEAEFTMRELEA